MIPPIKLDFIVIDFNPPNYEMGCFKYAIKAILKFPNKI
ncbi:MAG: hypothetical protein BAJALOKI2v1_10106 [Promethearchaeota archaeon]|nr:MAG: hypothetical protein BAJALOKI2v1_10106 [Candidatus Lokiarchaeota archaeon]